MEPGTLTMKQCLEIIISGLRSINVPVCYMAQIGVPIQQQIENLQECIKAIDEQEKAIDDNEKKGGDN